MSSASTPSMVSAPVFSLVAAASAAELPVALVKLLTDQGMIDVAWIGGHRVVTAAGLQQLLELVAAADRRAGVRAGGRN